MGLKIGEAFKDRCFITVVATGLPATALVFTCTVIDESGNRAALVVTEESDGWYTAPFTPDAAGTWATEWSKAANPQLYTFHYPYKEFKVGGGQEDDIYTRLGAPSGASVSADVAAIKAETASLVTKVDAVDDYVDTEVAAIKAKTDNLPADPADDSDIDAQLAVIDEFHDVPAQNSALNAQINEVIGNKTDTTAGDSLVALAKLIKAKTDNLPVDPADESNTQGDLDTILADTNELQTDWVNGGRLDLLIDAIKARTDNHEITKAFFGPCLIAATADTTHTDIALGSVTLPNIAGTITHVYAGIKFRMVENTNVAANKLNGAQEIQVDTVDAINFVDHQFGVAASTREGGDCIIGAVDLVATVDVFNHAYAFVWDEPLTEVDSLVFNDVQPFLIVSYY